MEFKNLTDIIEKKEQLSYEKHIYENAVENSKKEKKKSEKRHKSYWDPIIINYKEIVEQYNAKIMDINKIINQLSTYPKEILIPFILECINLHEDEKYVYRNIVLSQTSNFDGSVGFCATYTPYEIIFPERLLETEMQLEKTFYISVLYPAYRQLFEENNVKYIMMPSTGYLHLVSPNLNLLSYFNRFPYLEEIGVNLIERKIKEEDKKMADILNDELEALKEQKKKIKD